MSQVENASQQRVIIVGAGAAGTACAWSLSLHPERFLVEVWEKESQSGGVATTETVTGSNGEEVPINDGVQGGSYTYRNVLAFLEKLGLGNAPDLKPPTERGTAEVPSMEEGASVAPAGLTVAFGKGPTAWGNICPTPFAAHNESDIARFGKVLKTISKLEPIFAFVPIRLVLTMYGFSKEFTYGMVFPLVALFFGTGNQTPNVSSAIVARVFLDPKLRLFDYDSKWLISQTPQMFAFPPLKKIYEAAVAKTPGVKWKFNCPVMGVHRLSPSELRRAEVEYKKFGKGPRPGKIQVTDWDGLIHYFDAIVFACDAETIRTKLLPKAEQSHAESFALNSVQYFSDISVTHTDREYMDRCYETDLGERKDDSEISSTSPTSAMYFVRAFHPETHPDEIEMSFDLSNYQPVLKNVVKDDGSHSTKKKPSVFQTIFLDVDRSARWTADQIDPKKILLKKWWRQFGHTWKHYLKVVPMMRFLQSKSRGTFYCGSWTLVNTHEVAVISGFAAAYRLGAPYPFDGGQDELATDQFEQYLFASHGIQWKRRGVDTKQRRVTNANKSLTSFLLACLLTWAEWITEVVRFFIG